MKKGYVLEWINGHHVFGTMFVHLRQSTFFNSSLYQCPQCQTSLGDMASHWQWKDEEISNWEMPPHLKDFKVKVIDQQCSTTDSGLLCLHTGSVSRLPAEDRHGFPYSWVEVHGRELWLIQHSEMWTGGGA